MKVNSRRMLKQIQKARKIFSFGCQYPKSFSPYIVDSLLPFDNLFNFIDINFNIHSASTILRL